MIIKVTFFDLESTSENPATAEILTGFFRTLLINFKDLSYEVTDELFVQCKPRRYIQESFEIHGITGEQAANFPDKRYGLRSICEYLSKHNDGFFCCHANAFLFGITGHFDWTLIRNALYDISEEAYHWFNQKFRSTKVISTHTISKKVLGTSRDISKKLKELAKHYGLGEYKEHDAIQDVEMLIKVFIKLIDGIKVENEIDLYDVGHYTGTRNWNTNGLLI